MTSVVFQIWGLIWQQEPCCGFTEWNEGIKNILVFNKNFSNMSKLPRTFNLEYSGTFDWWNHPLNSGNYLIGIHILVSGFCIKFKKCCNTTSLLHRSLPAFIFQLLAGSFLPLSNFLQFTVSFSVKDSKAKATSWRSVSPFLLLLLGRKNHVRKSTNVPNTFFHTKKSS